MTKETENKEKTINQSSLDMTLHMLPLIKAQIAMMVSYYADCSWSSAFTKQFFFFLKENFTKQLPLSLYKFSLDKAILKINV